MSNLITPKATAQSENAARERAETPALDTADGAVLISCRESTCSFANDLY
jgi:hypothetical protein